jgi:hypothetical protein
LLAMECTGPQYVSIFVGEKRAGVEMGYRVRWEGMPVPVQGLRRYRTPDAGSSLGSCGFLDSSISGDNLGLVLLRSVPSFDYDTATTVCRARRNGPDSSTGQLHLVRPPRSLFGPGHASCHTSCCRLRLSTTDTFHNYNP